MLTELASDLWVATRPQRFFGLEVGARMTVIRLRDGGLWLHSPLRLDGGLREALGALGPVRFAVAPNRLHHLYAGELAAHDPDVRLWVGPGVPEKRPDLACEGVLGDEAPPEWRGQIDQVFFAGRPYENEVTFFHRASRTLILCDLAFHFSARFPWTTRLVARILGNHEHFGPSRFDPLLIRDRAAARASLEKILAWDFDRVIVAHGEVLETGGHAALREGYAWLLR